MEQATRQQQQLREQLDASSARQLMPSQLHTDQAPATAPSTFKLRVCNGFTWTAPIEMKRTKEMLAAPAIIPYKECRDYLMPLLEGDELDFRAGDLEVGTF